MQYQFLNIFLDKKELLKQKKYPINQFLLENNATQLEAIYDFYGDDSKILLINGFLGIGKVQVLNYSFNFLSSEALILRCNCFESTILDDILLTFFEEFKKLHSQKIINPPKTKTENFTQKINSYFSTIDKPFIIVIDSFEAVLNSNKQEILDFLFHLATFEKIKIVIVSRVFKTDVLPKDIKYKKVLITALDKPLLEKYLKESKVKYTSSVLDEFYKHSRGYFFFTTLTIQLLKLKNVSLAEFMQLFQSSFLSYSAFLRKEAAETIPALAVKLFWFLCLLRHGIPLATLKSMQMYNEEWMNFLEENLIVTQENSMIYVQDFYKEQIETIIPQNISKKIHQFICDLYEKQLPLKPSERGLLLSRQTMRSELEVHSLFLPKKITPSDLPKAGLGYAAISKSLEMDYSNMKNKDKEKTAPAVQPENQQTSSEPIGNVDLSALKDIEINLKNLPFKLSEQEMKLLENEFDTANSENNSGVEVKVNIEETEKEPVEPQTFEEILQKAQKEENTYHYFRAVELYNKALEFEDNKNYNALLPNIYTRMALAYKNMSDWENALLYYTLAKNLCEKSGETVKTNYLKLSIANIYYETYKPAKAKEVLLEIINFPKNPAILTTKAYIELSNIEESLNNNDAAFEYCKDALKNSNATMDIETLSQLYFKYALNCDDRNDIKSAAEYYDKCIQLSQDTKINKFLSSAYSNLATLHYEKNNTQLAIDNYLNAYEIDEKTNNFDGMYFSASKLAQIYQRKSPETSLEYLQKAKECAQLLNDIFLMASSALAIGDFYYDSKDNEKALREYLWAYDLVKNDFSKDNIAKIQMRINDIKFKIGKDKFKALEDEIRNEQE